MSKKATTKYVVYELNNVMGSEKHKALEKVEFDSVNNSFSSEEDAIDAILKEDLYYANYLIIKNVYVN